MPHVARGAGHPTIDPCVDLRMGAVQQGRSSSAVAGGCAACCRTGRGTDAGVLHGQAVAIRGIVLAAALGLVSGAGAAGELVGQVVSVHDGDTLTVLVDRRQVKVRLAEIDAPELGQTFGRRSRESLTEMCAGKNARIDDRGKDRFGRTLGLVGCAGVDANAAQVRRGMAWVYDRYVRDRGLYAVQDEARKERRGLWADLHPVAPWEWRQTKRRATPPSQTR